MQKTPFDLSRLNTLVYARGFTLWHYRSHTHSLYELTASGFFGEAASLMSAGDCILLVGTDGARMALVSSADFGVISLVPLT